MSTEDAPLLIDALRSAYRERFGLFDRGFLASAPGRVNLMGDHVDYAGLPVLPMAIQRRVSLLCSAADGPRVRIASTQPRFRPREFLIAARVEPYEPGDWGNYAKATARALARRSTLTRGIDAVVHSDIPIAAGLSSSSALVVAVALALLRVNEIELDRLELAALLAEGERYVGTRGGGMDQAICLAAQPGTAARVEFDPLRVTPVPLPPDWRFVVADSGVRAEKAGSARETYNARAAEVRRALDAVAARFGSDPDDPPARPLDYRRLLALPDLEDPVDAARGILDPVLYRRFSHVINEGRRVGAAERALREGDIGGFGQLMRESHASLRDDFEVSHPALDRLVEICLEAGAAGTRLTGAGLGGCLIALCDVSTARDVLLALRSSLGRAADSTSPPDPTVLVAEAAGGAEIRSV